MKEENEETGKPVENLTPDKPANANDMNANASNMQAGVSSMQAGTSKGGGCDNP